MGITSAINNAMSGLRVTSRAAELVSRNVSNAQVEGYTQKTLAQSHQIFGGLPGGVKDDGVMRAGDPFVTAARRRGEAQSESLSLEADALRRVADALIDPDGGDSLHSRYVAFEDALRGLADTPESSGMRRNAVEAAVGLANKLNTLSTDAKRMRMEADRDIQRQVEEVNRALREIQQLSREIAQTEAAGRDASGLEDERQRQIDVVNAIVPIKASKPTQGGMFLTTEEGGILSNGTIYELSFTPSGDVQTANMLGGLTHLDVADADPATARMGGGTLEAAFKVRDEIAVDYAAQLDALAADLIDGFQQLDGYAAYTDEASGDSRNDTAHAGLFTDAGAAFVFSGDIDAAGDVTSSPDKIHDSPVTPAEADALLIGLAGRIAVNAAIDPAKGGAAEAITTDFMPVLSGAEPSMPTALYAAFRTPLVLDGATPPGSVVNLAGTMTRIEMVSGVASLWEISASGVESEARFRDGATQALRAEELTAQGVDTDEEMRRLLVIEKAYAANARVLQVADQMIATLLEI